MSGWFADTLSKRLLLLMWATLVGSHFLAFAAVHAVHLRDGRSLLEHLPTLPSLPPTPGVPDARVDAGPGEAGRPHRPPGPPHHDDRGPPGRSAETGDPAGQAGPDGRGDPDRRGGPSEPDGHGGPRGPGGPGAFGGPSLPWDALLLDYGVRFAVIAFAAWFGSRWLALPMRRLVQASSALGGSLADESAAPALDERSGTREVRETARVFNAMARRLREQFRARGLMVAAISHDLRTPLTRLRVRLESMDADVDLQQRSVADIREMNELIDNALEVFRLDSPAYREAPQRTDVSALVQSLTDDLAEQGMAVAFAGAPAIAETQPAALRRVVQNLVGNALRYGGRADVRVTADVAGVRIVVEDDGPGIAPDELEAVFEPFYRVEASRNRHTGGTGLGLHIARDLMARQGGTLMLANRAEGGLRAEVLLPKR